MCVFLYLLQNEYQHSPCKVRTILLVLTNSKDYLRVKFGVRAGFRVIGVVRVGGWAIHVY